MNGRLGTLRIIILRFVGWWMTREVEDMVSSTSGNDSPMGENNRKPMEVNVETRTSAIHRSIYIWNYWSRGAVFRGNIFERRL